MKDEFETEFDIVQRQRECSKPAMHGQRLTALVRIRRDLGRDVRPEAEQLEGKTFEFKFGWSMNSDDPYPGEVAWIPHDPRWPANAPHWMASGDLQAVA